MKGGRGAQAGELVLALQSGAVAAEDSCKTEARFVLDIVPGHAGTTWAFGFALV